MPRKPDNDDIFDFDPEEEAGEEFDPEEWYEQHPDFTREDIEALSEEELDALSDFIEIDFPELDYLDDLENLADDDDFYSTK